MSLWSKKVRNLLSRKQRGFKQPAISSSADRLHTPEITSNQPHLPPEIILQILEQLPFESLWLSRGTCRQWNSFAVNELWKVISETSIMLHTAAVLDVERLGVLGARMEPIVPENPHTPSTLAQSGKKIPLTTTQVTWRVKHPRSFQWTDMYKLDSIVIVAGPKQFGVRYGFSLEGSVSYGRLRDFKRIETWSSNAKRQSRFTALFSRKGGQQDPIKFDLADPRSFDWNIKYLCEYNMDSVGQYPPVYRMRSLTPLDASLPLSQVAIICSHFESLKQG